jgi:type II secretory pathway component GspD/PulD (secretin)
VLLLGGAAALAAVAGLAGPVGSARAQLIDDGRSDPQDQRQPEEPAPAEPQANPPRGGGVQVFRPGQGRAIPAGVNAPAAADQSGAAEPGTAQQAGAPGGEDQVTLPALGEPLEITALIEFVQAALGVNFAVEGTPTGTITFNAPLSVPKSRLLGLLDAMLERYEYTVTLEPETGFYVVHPIGSVRPSFSGEQATTKILRTPNVKPSLLRGPIIAAMVGPGSDGNVGAALQAAGQLGSAPAVGGGVSIQAIDELGVLMVTGSARKIRAVEEIIEQILSVGDEIDLHRIELDHLAAPVARERAIGLVGGSTGARGAFPGGQNIAQIAGQDPGASASGFAGSTLDNLSERLAVDTQSNALLFRGTRGELARVEELMAVIDRPSTLEPRNYFAGGTAQQIADIASQRGLGEVVLLNEDAGLSDQQLFFRSQQQALQGGQGGGTAGGPVMVVDLKTGRIVYYGTTSQHAQLDELMKELKTDDDRVVIRDYKLKHAQAEDVADVLDQIITGARRTAEGGLLPETQGGGVAQVRRDITPVVTADGEVALIGAAGNDVSASFDPNQVIVVPDVLNNQILVRAPVRQQDQMSKLISRIDQRRSQVMIEVTIISVSDTRDFRLAVEAQILNGQYGLQSNFGLSSVGTGNGFLDQRVVAANLPGFTSAIVQSDSIPLIVNAVQTDTDARIVSNPQLLVNDNEEASIVSTNQEPTTSTSQGDNSTITSFQGYEEAGTTLTVTPSISEGGYLRLTYEVELSSFTGAGTEGVPPPRQVTTVGSAVTVPSDSTIVVGGIKARNDRKTIVKVPLIGDIPILGEAFKDRRRNSTDSVLYVFITPRIMTDPNFYDLKLYTQGPQAAVELDTGVPDLQPLLIGPSSEGLRPGAGAPPALPERTAPVPTSVPTSGPSPAPSSPPESMAPTTTPGPGTAPTSTGGAVVEALPPAGAGS